MKDSIVIHAFTTAILVEAANMGYEDSIDSDDVQVLASSLADNAHAALHRISDAKDRVKLE